MTDIHDMRVRLREERGHAPAAAKGRAFRIPFGVLAACAIAVGFVVVMFTPKIYSVQRTAALPVFKDVRVRAEEAAQAATPPAAPLPAAKTDYAGKSPDEAAKLADAVCIQRVAAVQNGPKVATENERLHCFLSEAPARFCSGSQRRKATADIINYFKGIEYANTALVMAKKVMVLPGANRAPMSGADAGPVLLTPDERVVGAIEGLMRAGYLMRAHREDIAANVPRAYKDRFARIVGNVLPCPEPPWWAVWR